MNSSLRNNEAEDGKSNLGSGKRIKSMFRKNEAEDQN